MKQTFLIILLAIMTQIGFAQNDPYLWLEDVDAQKSLDWVGKWNDKTLKVLMSQPGYQEMYEKDLEIYNSTDRIANPSIIGNLVYNFWQDEEHPRGIWRRTALQSYLGGDPHWETVIDIDALSEKDGEKYVFKGATGLYPDYNRFLINLSKGGGDAVVIREFDAINKVFLQNGFYIPEAKGGASWIDLNTLMVATDFGDGVTTSGYPRQVKIWQRDTDLKNAQLIFDGKEDDMGIWGYTSPTKDKTYQIITQRTSFYSGYYYFIENGELIKLDLPEDIELSGIFNKQVLLSLKSDWNIGDNSFKQGDLVSIPYADLIAGGTGYQLIVRPDERSSITETSATKNVLLVNMLNNVKSELYKYTYNGTWKKEKINAPEYGNISLGSTDDESDTFFFYFENFLAPSTLYKGDASTGKFTEVKALKSWFPTEKYQVQQFEVASKDGTMIPYFVVSSKEMKLSGKNPTLISAYGGFEVPRLPNYSAITGISWLEKGGVYVLANIRGGGEFGPKWHQAGLKENRQRIYDDYFAVAEDLIARKITNPKKLGISGGSNGGLLVGVGFTQRPDLYNAVVCAVPLLDMKRYNKLLAGASWMAEYGNPDIPEEWEYIKKYSPYQNVKEGMDYPEVFFYTSTRDDRVHPGHARKMVAKMSEMGYKVYYFENTEGGHAGASTNEQRAQMAALQYSYLQMKLMR
ncbi:prolyl oligopeptidase family serine peptidase [Maribellus sp. YY47]|uniref:prolyl oligopeptidase family serine peptidase n=1 Tax=Maribellus sp. YY47 TaxID=2929486 RepID=UPI002001A6B4|nr:prolyl oligopeptidase family serine peptidase [Maribellus sp. YY47]MCK3684770.1 prolyl oligopeptidase family serine peptidase [Maribellus sp. YY47]